MDTKLLKKSDINLISKCFLFEHADQEAVLRAISDEMCTLVDFNKGIIVFEKYDYRNSLGLVLSGSLEVTKPSGRRYIMKTLSGGGLFGSANLFCSDPDIVTVITAISNSRIIFFPQVLLARIMQESYMIAENYIRFLSGRVRFLNEKIQSLISVSADAALARYLIISATEQDGRIIVNPGTSISALAEELNIGRASLYRAFEDLEKAGLIIKTGRKIEITNLDGLSNV